jgi:hypothetical protein
VAVMSNDGRPSSIFSLRRRQLPDAGGRPVVVGSGSGSVHWMDARNGGSGRELKRSVSFPVPRCGDFDAKSELQAGYRSGSVHRCGQSKVFRGSGGVQATWDGLILAGAEVAF